jgi:membrane protein implicated in regulation of membrane protease activity
VKFTRARDLATAGLLAVVVVYLAIRLLYDTLPPLPTFAGVTLLVLAIVEAALGTSLRGRIKRRFEGRPDDGKPLQPLTVARAVALAKASSLLGAIMLGAWIGVGAYLLPRRDELSAAANDMPSAVVGVVSSALLIAAALWLEYCCRTPKDQEGQRPEPGR